MSFFTIFITLILVMDPLGNIPLFLSIIKASAPHRYARIILRETFIAFLVLTVFLFFGEHILKGLSITMPALGIAGGVILFLIAIRMIFPDAQEVKEVRLEEPFIVPLAVPLTAGPSAMATVMLFAAQHPLQIWQCFLALVLASILFATILLGAKIFMRVLGKSGIVAIERLMGMVLTTLAVQMFLTGLESYLHLGKS